MEEAVVQVVVRRMRVVVLRAMSKRVESKRRMIVNRMWCRSAVKT